MPKIGRSWICDECGKWAELHTTEGIRKKKGQHEYFCSNCYYKYQPSTRGWENGKKKKK